MSRTRRTAFAASVLLALLAATPALAQNTIYQWVDANGVTHFSGQPPEDQAYEERVVTASSSRTVTEQEREASRGPATASTTEPSDTCVRARANLTLLQSDQQLMVDRDGDGEPEVIGDEERARQRALAEAQVQAFCPQS